MKELFDENNSEHLDRNKYRVVEWELDGRKPTSVSFGGTFKTDASRRDFSFNSLALDARGNIIDYFHGIDDLKHHMVKAIGCPYDRFAEDFLRMLRAVRFCARLGFDIDRCTFNAIEDLSFYLEKISVERIFEELYKMASLGGEKFGKAIELLDELNLLQVFLPEISSMKHYFHAPIHHPEGAKAIRKSDGKVFDYCEKEHKNNKEFDIQMGTVWDHCIAAVKRSTSTDPELNLAILFHDIGKPSSFVKKFDKERGIEKYTYHGHEVVGVQVFEKIADRLRISNNLKKKICFCIENHMKVHLFPKMKKSKITTLVTHKFWEDLKYVSYCDDSCRKDAFNPEHWKDIENTANNVLEQLKTQENILKMVDGKTIMELCNIPSGPLVGKILKNVKEQIIINKVLAKDDVKNLVVKTFKEFKE